MYRKLNLVCALHSVRMFMYMQVTYWAIHVYMFYTESDLSRWYISYYENSQYVQLCMKVLCLYTFCITASCNYLSVIGIYTSYTLSSDYVLLEL